METRVPTLDEIQDARRTIAGIALRTPLVRLNIEDDAEIYLKLENLQPIGSFKIRGAANAMKHFSKEQLTPRGTHSICGQHGSGCGLECQEDGRFMYSRCP